MEQEKKQKVLLTTVVKNGTLYDYFGSNIPEKNFFRLSLKRRTSYGLRFLQYNIPQIEILEYPSWNKFKKKINKGKYDIVGFSFYLNDIPLILKMVEYAREKVLKFSGPVIMVH